MPATLGKYNISSYVNDLIPEHVASTYPDLVEFIEVYALYLERQNKSAFYLNSLDIQRDIDYVESTLLNELQNEIGVAVPREFAADSRTFYKHLIEFYRSRGTPESIKSFFRMIYDDEVETYFPFTDLLIPSDGAWDDKSDALIATQPPVAAANFTVSNVPVVATSFKEGVAYTIVSPTGTTQAQWVSAGVITGTTAAAGVTFVATGAGVGTGTANAPTVISGSDDAGFAAIFNDAVIYVNSTYQTPKTDYVETVYSESATTKYKLEFTTVLTDGDVVKTYPRGSFTTPDGFISDIGTYKPKIVQDSYYYQKFSYVLKTGSNVENWKNAFTRLIHPAGFIFFGEILILIELLTSANKKAQPGWLVYTPIYLLDLAKIQIGPATLNRIGTHTALAKTGAIAQGTRSSTTAGYSNVEKLYSMTATGSGGDTNAKWDLGSWDHWDYIKFNYLGHNRGFANYTIQDAINNDIGIQLNHDVMSIPWVRGTITAGSFITNSFYKILSAGTTDYTLIGSANNTVGTIFKATGAGTGTGTAEVDLYDGLPYTSTVSTPYIVNGTNQNSDTLHYIRDYPDTHG